MTRDTDKLRTVLKPLWLRFRFYILIIFSTLILLAILFRVSSGEYIPENTIPAFLSLLNSVTAYVVSRRKQGDRTYKQMMRNIFLWTSGRFLAMLAVLIIVILSKAVEPLPFIFSFIGFYIMHQLIEIGILKQETK